MFTAHRPHNSFDSFYPPTFVASARPVNRNEWQGIPDAEEAYWKEWNNLENKQVWKWDTLAEWDDVARHHRKQGTECHFGYLFGFMVLKGDEFDEHDPRRRYKYRIVFQGNQVKDQDWQVALFQNMTCQPATLDAARAAEAYGCFPGHTIEGRDVEQAYISATLRGPPTYVQLPKELWTPEMHKMKFPVVRLDKALYGHINSGVYWNEHCDAMCKSKGFESVKHFGENWSSCYFNEETKMFLIVYVDDLLLAGPKEHMEKTWDWLTDMTGKNGLALAKPPEKDDDTHTFLGCTTRRYTKVIDGKTVQFTSSSVEPAMRKALAKYEVSVYDCTGKYPRLYKVNTPGEEEELSLIHI